MDRKRSQSKERARWLGFGALSLAGLAAVWVASGFRTLDPERELVVRTSPFHDPQRLEGRFGLAPPGLARVERYPLDPTDLALPVAAEAMLPTPEGARFGLRGSATVRARARDFRALHAASHGAGLHGVLAAAVRETARSWTPGPPGAAPTRPTAERARALEVLLASALDSRGVDLVRFSLDEIDWLQEGPSDEPQVTTKLLVIGLDGADWSVIDERLARGEMPHLASLVAGGVRAKLLSLNPMISPVVWTTIATGVPPSVHGVLDFLVVDPGGAGLQPVTAGARRVATFWDMLSQAGIDVGVVGWWATWPAEAVRGYVVSDRIAYQLFGYRADLEDATGKTWPAELYDDIRGSIVDPERVEWERIAAYLSGPRGLASEFDAEERTMLDGFRTLLASGDSYLEIADALRRRHHPRLEVVYFEGTDTASHLFMPYRPPAQPGLDPARSASFAAVVDRYYETTDAMIGQLLEGRGEEWTVMVLSDHGFATDATRPRSFDSRIGHGPAAAWHRRFGILVLNGPQVRRGERIAEAGVYDIAPTILALFGQGVPRSWPGRVLGRALNAEFLEQHPVRYRLDNPERPEPTSGAGEEPGAAALLEKLRNLGYVGGGGAVESTVTAYNNAGLSLLDERRPAEAEAQFRAALVRSPGQPLLLVNLARALRAQGRLGEAERAMEELFERPDPPPTALHLLAQLRLETGRVAEAEQLVRELLRLEPDAADARNTLGQVLERQGRSEAAASEYRRAAASDPHAGRPRNNLANLLQRRGAWEEAERLYLEAIEADPHFMGSYNNLALLYQRRGQVPRAIELYARALDHAPDDAVVQSNLGSLYFEIGDLDEAERLWRRSRESDREYPSPLNNLAGLAISRQRYPEAEELLREALDLDPNYGDAHLNRAVVLETAGDTEGARAALERATGDPRSAVLAWTRLGRFELGQGRLDAAERALGRAIQADPPPLEALNALAEVYVRLDRHSEALALLRRSLALDPGQPLVRGELQRLERSSG